MASGKERARWERWYDQVSERMERQKKSITRLVLILTEGRAALEEIADKDSDIRTIAQARKRAQESLDRMREPAAAAYQSVEESEAEEPVLDPRRKY